MNKFYVVKTSCVAPSLSRVKTQTMAVQKLLSVRYVLYVVNDDRVNSTTTCVCTFVVSLPMDTFEMTLPVDFIE